MCIRDSESGAWKTAWSTPTSPAYSTRRATNGGTDHLARTSAAKQGGAAVLGSQALVDTTVGDPLVASLHKSTRWAEAFCPLAPHRRGRRGPPGIYVASFYGIAGGDSTELFKQVAAAAARVGQAPYFICMDANIDLRDNAFLLQMLRDGWHNVCLLYTSPSPRDATLSRMPSSA